MKKNSVRLLWLLLAVVMVSSLLTVGIFAEDQDAPVAKVGDTEYTDIDDAIAAWTTTNNATLTLLSDVTLSDVIKLSSTEYHILDLGTYTMTAAKGKDAIQYVVNGRSSASYALDIKADATNPGGITATGKAIVSHIKPSSNAPAKDRPITRFYGGVFNASYVVKQGGNGWITPGAGYTGASAPCFHFYGGEFNGTIYTNRSLNQFHGGTFNGSLSMSVDSSAYTQVAGGTFKNLSNSMGSALNSEKFVIGTAKGANDGSVCIDENGYYVITTTTPTNAEASVASNYNSSNYFYYSTVNTSGMYYEDVYDAIEANPNGTITVYTDELDLTDSSFKGTIVVPEGETIKIVTAANETPAWTVSAAEGAVKYTDAEGNELVKGENGVFVEKITEVATYDELVAALAEGGKIKLMADITVDTKITAIDGTTIDLNDKTLYINVENSEYNNVTIQNGNIVLGKDDVHVCDGYFKVLAGKTLVLNAVKVSSAEGGIKGYAVFHLYTGAKLDLTNNCELNISDNEYAAGYIVYAGEATATVNISDSTVIGSKVNGIVHATTVIYNSTFTITNAIEHGINRSGVTITDSTVSISGGTGRGITAQHGSLVIDGISNVTIEKMGEATIELRNNQNLTIAETATVKLDAAVNNTTSGTITGTVILPPMGNDFTGYTRGDAIWGEVWGNASESFVIKVLDANGNVMGTTSLNNVNGIIDGDVNVTWSLKLDAASNTDEYWTMAWITAPTIDNMPAKVELWVDGVKVSGGDVVLNAPDNLNKIYAAVTDSTGKILSFHTDVQEAIKAAAAVSGVARTATAGTVEFLDNVTVDKWIMFAEKMNIGNGKLITLNINGVTIDGNNHTLTIKSIESAGNGGRLFYDAQNLTIKDLTINYANGVVGGIGLQSGTIENVTINGGVGVFPGEGDITVTGCTFNTSGSAIYNETDRDNLVVTNNRFETAEGQYAIYLRGNTTFTDNTVISGKVNVVSGSPVVTGNDFGNERFKVYNAATATIEENTINNLVFNEPNAFAGSTFANNTLSEEAQAAIGALFALAGSGTAEDPFLIKDIDDLIWFRDQVDSLAQDGSTQFAGKYFKLTADIDLEGINWNPIGTMSGDHGSFKGVFDGGDHTIYNLNVQQAGNGLGLFARTAGNAEIKNLKLHNVTVKSTNNSNCVGALVGNSYASTKISNVHVTGTIDISGRGYIGGISGHGYVVMDDVSVVGTGTISSTFWCAGGILGYGGEGATNIMNAHVEGITITSAAGGLGAIVGMAEDNGGTQPISGSNLSAKNVEIKTYTGGYSDIYANYALGYLYGGNPTSKLTGTLSVENVNITTFTGETPKVNDAVAQVGDAIYFDLQSAVNAGGTVVLLRDVTLTETLTIPADKTVVLNLNGKTIGQEKACTAHYEMILNKGTLTITGEGKISFKDTGAGDPNHGWGSYTINNRGTLVVENGTIEHLGEQAFATHMICAIQQSAGTTTINGGVISTPAYRSVRVNRGDLVINGGEFDGQVWLQPNQGDATITVTGGTFGPNGRDGSSIFMTNKGEGYTVTAATISGGVFTTKIGASDPATLSGAITGGSFTEAAKNGTNAALIDKDMKFGDTVDENGYYVIVEKNYVAEIVGGEKYESLEEALKALKDGDTLTFLADITIDGTWDCRTNGAKITANNVTIHGGYHTLTLTGAVDDKNWNTVFRIEGEGVQVMHLTIDASAATGIQRGISTKLGIYVNDCTFIGNGTTAKYGVIYGEGAGDAISSVEVLVANSRFKNWSYGVSDNRNGQDALHVVVGTNTFENAGVIISASEEIFFGDNTMINGYVNINSYSVPNELKVDAENNTLTANTATKYNQIVAKTIEDASDIFLTPVAEVNGKLYLKLADALAAAKDGDTLTLLADIALSETLKVTGSITLDLNGKTITGTDNATGNFALIEVQSGAELTVKDETGAGKITLVATNERGTSSYSSVISNQRGKLTVDGGTLEHLGGTYMAYAIDNLTNGKGTYAETVINGGTVKSTYRAIRQFLNGVEAQNILTINGGTIEGANKSVWMQDPSANANTGTLTIGENASLKGDVYLTVTKGSTEWPVQVSISAAALKDGAEVMTSNVPAGYELSLVNGTYGVFSGAAKIGNTYYATLDDAFAAAKDDDEVVILVAGTYKVPVRKNITITGAVDGVKFDMSKAVGVYASMTFNNVTFEYGNANYVGLQHAGTMVYNNCTINGQVFLYGTSETFNGCTFNQISKDAYNVWTYGGKKVEFNDCIFNSAGKSVLIYSEDGNLFNDVTVTDCDFIASAPVDGKAAIEMDSSRTAGIKLTIDAATTVEGFGTGNVSGNSLWNNKEWDSTDANNDITVVVNNETVLAPVTFVAKIGDTGYTSLADALAAAKDQKDIVIDLLADATLDITAWQTLAIGGDTTETITINGNGKTLTFNKLNSDWDHIATNNDAKLILNDMTITDSGYNNGPWNRYDINFACDVELNNVDSTKALAFKADAALNDVTINEIGDNYAIWIQANGQKVTIDGLTVTSAGRGIKISEEYVNAPGKVELAVSNATFTTVKKAAVLVGSKAGATITASNVNIDNVTQDPVNFVWVDEDWAAHYGEVTVIGGTLAQESVESFVAALINNDAVVGYYATLADAINAAEDGDTVTLLAPIVVKAGETLILNKDITITYTSNVPGEDMITNKGNLIIDGTTLVYVNTDTTASNVTVSTISCEPGSTLTVTGGVVKNDSANNGAKGIYAFAIDLLTNGSLGDVTATINGGEIICTNYMAIRQFNNGEACKNTLNVNGGYIYGAKRAIQIHLKNNAAYTTITDGTIEAGDYSLCFLTTSENITVSGGTFIGSVWYSGTDGFISGGNFSEPVAEAYCAEGYIPTENADGTYGVKEGEYVARDMTTGIGYETLADALAAAKDQKDIVIDLLADATLDIAAWQTLAIGGETTETITINGNGNTLTFNKLNSDWDHIATNNDAKLILNDMTITDSGYNNGPWNRYDINFACDVELNNVDSTKALAFKADAALNDVTINETGDNYAIWIQANGQDVTIDGLTVTSAGRGIKISEEYVNAPAKVELAVSNATFTTVKKAAVLVGSKAGATITASNVDITKVQQDPVNFVWVDEDWAAHYGEVTVIGGTLAQESVESFKITVKTEKGMLGYYNSLQDALNAAAAASGNVTVEILDDIDLAGITWNPVTVSAPGYPVVTVNGNHHIITNLSDMLFAGTWAGKSGLIINDLTIKNSTIKNDVDDSKGTVGVGAFIGYPQASAVITLNNCHLVDSHVEGGHWTGGLIGMAGGYNGNDGPVFMNLTIKDCSVTGSTITGKGSAGGIIGHGSCAAWTNVDIDNVTVTGNTITSTGSSTNKAGSIMGTIGAAGQPTTANGTTLTGGATVSATVSGNTVTSGGTTITTIYGRQGTPTGMLVIDGGNYDAYPIETGVAYAKPADGYVIVKNTDGTYSLTSQQYVAQLGNVKYESLQAAVDAAKPGNTIILLDNVYGAGVVINKNLTINFNGFTYTLTTPVGSTGTESNGFQILKGNNVTLRNGTLQVADYAADLFYILVQNYADLTVYNMTLDGANLDKYAFTDGDSYTLSNNSGNVAIMGSTVIANDHGDKAFAFDVCDQTAYGYELPTVTVNSVSKIVGNIEAVARVSTKYYATLQQAIDLGLAGRDVILLRDVAGAGVVINRDVKILFGTHTYTLTTPVGSTGTESNGFQILKGNNVTLQNGTLKVADEAANKFYILIQNYANLTVNNMTLDGSNLDKYAFTDGDSYTLSNNSGLISIGGTTKIIANKDGALAFAFDACDQTSKGYELPVVSVATTVTIEGNVEAAAKVGNKYYATLQQAIDAAANDKTIVVCKDINVGKNDTTTLDGKYNTMFKVEGKSVTIDLNGHKIYADAAGMESMLVGVFSTDNNGHLTLNDTAGGAVVEAASNGANVYGLIVNYEPGCSITINGGTYTLDKASDSLIYTGCDTGEGEGVVVNGGNFTLGNVGTGTNKSPWIFNAKGQNTANVIVTGGTFNSNICGQYYAHEVDILDAKGNLSYVIDNKNGTWTVTGLAAEVAIMLDVWGNYDYPVGYATFADAIKSIVKGQPETTIVLQKDITVKGQFIGHSYAQNVVIDLNGFKMSSTDKALTVYRAGTTVLLKNGTVHGNTTGGTIQVTYGGKLTLGENVTITCGGSANALKVDANSTLIIADETVKVLGGKNDLVVAENAIVEISAGFFKHPVNAEWCAEFYAPTDKLENGYYSVYLTAQATVTDKNGNVTHYATLGEAITKAADGSVITLNHDVNVTYDDAVEAKDGFVSFFVVSGKTITIDLNGKTVYGDATESPVKMVNGKSAPEGLLLGMFTTINNGHLTLKDSSNGQGTVELKAETGDRDANGMTTSYYAYGLIVNYDDDCSITIEDGNYIADDVYDALVYTSCDKGAVVNGGYFKLTNVGLGSRGNGSPWIFNARGQQIRSVVVNGGTFNANVNAQYWVFEVDIDKSLALAYDEETGTWTVVEAVAYVNKQHWASSWYTRETGYATLEEAFAALEGVKIKTSGKKTYTSAQDYVTVLNATPEDAKDILESAKDGDVVAIPAGTYTSFPASSLKAGVTVICPEGTVFEGTSALNVKGATVVGATFANDSGNVASGTVNGTFKNCTFEGYNALRNCYAGETVVFENCTFSGDVYGIHFDGGANDVVFKNCTFSGFNAMGAAITKLTMENCTFVANGTSGYNGINLWGDTEMIGCTFVFAGTATEWIDLCTAGKTATFTNCVVTDGTTSKSVAEVVGKRYDNATIIVDGVEQ